MASQQLALADSLYVDEDYEAAIKQYTAATAAASSSSSSPEGRFRALSHRAAAQLQIGKAADALEGAREALGLAGPLALRPGEEEACRRREALAAAALGGGDDEGPPPQKPPQLRDHKRVAGPPPPRPRPAHPTMPKYQYYQSDAVVTVSILAAKVRPEDLRVDFGLDKLTVILTRGGADFTVICGTLFDAVVVDRCKVVYKDDKVLIKLRKRERHQWHELFGNGAEDMAVEGKEIREKGSEESEPLEAAAAAPTEISAHASAADDAPASKATSTSRVRPYSSHKDWDAIERDLKAEEDAEKPEGDEALNKLFEGIYAKSDPDTRRAMVKSFQTSGGTVLSTNWGEVAAKDYEKERQAPKGQEWKNWEGDRLPQKDNSD